MNYIDEVIDEHDLLSLPAINTEFLSNANEIAKPRSPSSSIDSYQLIKMMNNSDFVQATPPRNTDGYDVNVETPIRLDETIVPETSPSNVRSNTHSIETENL